MRVKELQVDDLSVGQYVTVLEGDKVEANLGPMTIPAGEMYCGIRGDVLRVIAIDLPTVLVRLYRHRKAVANIDIDTRRCKLKACDLNYVKHVVPPWWAWWRW